MQVNFQFVEASRLLFCDCCEYSSQKSLYETFIHLIVNKIIPNIPTQAYSHSETRKLFIPNASLVMLIFIDFVLAINTPLLTQLRYIGGSIGFVSPNDDDIVFLHP